MQILGTNINDAVQRGMLELRNTAGRRRPLSSVILLLTDGQATHGETDQNTITRNARTANSNSQIILHSIAFGEFTLKLLKFTQLTGGSADYQLMKDLSMDNEGVARRIYTDHDAGVQLEGFYEEISTPLLGNVNIEYIDGAAQIGSLVQVGPSINRVINESIRWTKAQPYSTTARKSSFSVKLQIAFNHIRKCAQELWRTLWRAHDRNLMFVLFSVKLFNFLNF